VVWQSDGSDDDDDICTCAFSFEILLFNLIDFVSAAVSGNDDCVSSRSDGRLHSISPFILTSASVLLIPLPSLLVGASTLFISVTAAGGVTDIRDTDDRVIWFLTI